MGGRRFRTALRDLGGWFQKARSIIFPKGAAEDLGVAQGRGLYFDADQATPNDYIYCNGGANLDFRTNGGGRMNITNTYVESKVDLGVSDGKKLFLEGSAGDTYIIRTGGLTKFYHDGANKFYLGSYVEFLTHANPSTDDSVDLGISGRRWRNVKISQTAYLSDGAGNCVTGIRNVGSADAWMMMPKMTTAQANAMAAAWGAPEQGRYVFDTTIGRPICWNGAAWVPYA